MSYRGDCVLSGRPCLIRATEEQACVELVYFLQHFPEQIKSLHKLGSLKIHTNGCLPAADWTLVGRAAMAKLRGHVCGHCDRRRICVPPSNAVWLRRCQRYNAVSSEPSILFIIKDSDKTQTSTMFSGARFGRLGQATSAVGEKLSSSLLSPNNALCAGPQCFSCGGPCLQLLLLSLQTSLGRRWGRSLTAWRSGRVQR